MLNPCCFTAKDFIESIYSGKVYQIIEPNKKGMAKLKNIETELVENWNSCNNPHFKKLIQQKIF